ncbi:MAG: M2 family metallopeptidase [Phycisphaerales bacterium]|nr:M2 family metallopeptidase [Phycisphaerales bacterium]
MRTIFCWLVVCVMVSPLMAESKAATPDEAAFVAVRDQYLAQYRPLWTTAQSAWWEANITGSDAAFAKKTESDKALAKLHSDKAVFQQLSALKKGDGVRDPILRRELEVIYNEFLPYQADPQVQDQIIAMENEVEQIFNTHRSQVGDKTLTENEVREILRVTQDSGAARDAWLGYIGVGRKTVDHLREGAKLRNAQATRLGFANFFEMQLALQELPVGPFWKLFDELDSLTRAPYAQLMAKIKDDRATQFGIKVDELRPWHFADIFFQEAPPADAIDLDGIYADTDLVKLTEKYYASMGMPCDDIIARSDLYEREGKTPHAFANDMDREGDIRVLCNAKSNAYWADTMVHEIGHAVYDKYIDNDVPFLLHTAAHSLTTEGIAMMFGAFVKNEDFLHRVRGLDAETAAADGDALRESLRAEKLIFSRWTQVMVRFEHAMYENPDQDLAALWWKLKAEYQLLPPPDDKSLPGFAAKIHIISHPVYYQSYMMGDVFAAQVRAHVAQTILGISDPNQTCFYGEPKAGDFFKKEIFGPGNLYSWDELTKRATGKALSAEAFAKYVIAAPRRTAMGGE